MLQDDEAPAEDDREVISQTADSIFFLGRGPVIKKQHFFIADPGLSNGLWAVRRAQSDATASIPAGSAAESEICCACGAENLEADGCAGGWWSSQESAGAGGYVTMSEIAATSAFRWRSSQTADRRRQAADLRT
jgi:hypothetical protein